MVSAGRDMCIHVLSSLMMKLGTCTRNVTGASFLCTCQYSAGHRWRLGGGAIPQKCGMSTYVTCRVKHESRSMKTCQCGPGH